MTAEAAWPRCPAALQPPALPRPVPGPPHASRQPRCPGPIPEEQPEPTEGHSGPEVPSVRGQLEAISGPAGQGEQERDREADSHTSKGSPSGGQGAGPALAPGREPCWSS